MKGVVLVNFGGPAVLEDLEPFLVSIFKVHLPKPLKPLAAFFAARRVNHSRGLYEKIGSSSPVVPSTAKLASSIQAKMPDYFVTYGMEHGVPSIADAEAEALNAGCEKPVLLPLYPLDDEEFCLHPDFIELMRRLTKEAIKKCGSKMSSIHLVFSAHSLPLFGSGARANRYKRAVEKLAELISASFVGCTGHVAYQSRMSRFFWLGPSTDEVIKNIAANDKAGDASVVIVPLGFICENLETLYEIDQVYLPLAASLFHGRAVRAMLPESAPELIDLLVKLATNRS